MLPNECSTVHEGNRQGQNGFTMAPHGNRGRYDDLDSFFFGYPMSLENEMERMQRQMLGSMSRGFGGMGGRNCGPFDSSFFAERPLSDFGPRDPMGLCCRYPTDTNRYGQDSYRHPMDLFHGRPCGNHLGPFYNPSHYSAFSHPHANRHSYHCCPQQNPMNNNNNNVNNSQANTAGVAHPGMMNSGMMTSGMPNGATMNNQGVMDSTSNQMMADMPPMSKGRWVTETMEGIYDGESEPIIKKTRSSFNTDGSILRRETQKRIGDRTLNVCKTKKIAHPAELAQSLTWDSETRSRPKNDAFTTEWREAKKKLTQGQSNPQHPPSTTHKALFNNANQQSLNAPNQSP